MATAWTGRIEQRWFVGAHSNVGGGYRSIRLRRHHSNGCSMVRVAGLICDHVTEVVPSPIGRLGPRDSYAEFATPFWTVLRAKRSYRTIDPIPEVRANRSAAKTNPVSSSRTSTNTSTSVWATGERRSNPPPNLVECAKRTQPARRQRGWHRSRG